MTLPGDVQEWADAFALLGDPSRLALIVTIRRDGPICVSDLADATGLKRTTVSHALRLLRAHDVVRARRSGHLMNYEITEHPLTALVDHVVRAVPSGSVRGASRPSPR
jgi:DNA-binding transcriptional ArsR family regulator